MGFWGTLGKIGGAIAAPFTGGASLIASDVLSNIGRTVGKGTDQAAQNRGAETEAQLYRDQIAMMSQQQNEQNIIQRAKLEMEQKAADAKAREDAGRTAMRADAVKNWKPAARPEGVSNISFTSAPGEGGIAAANEMERQALIRQLKGESYTQLPEMAAPYSVSPVKQAGVMEQIGNWAAPILSGYGALRQKQKQAPISYGDANRGLPHA